jgi:hypothetical protein
MQRVISTRIVILLRMNVITTLSTVISIRYEWVLHAECDFDTYECDYDTRECDYDTHESDYDKHEYNLYSHELNFNTIRVTLTRAN